MKIGHVTREFELEPKALDVDGLRRSFQERLVYAVGKDRSTATRRDWFNAVVLSLRDRMVDRWMETTRAQYNCDVKRVYYLSLEFLIGRLLTSGMANLGILEECRKALAEFGIDLDEVTASEPDAALGNGGLGRLAACFLDSMATLGLPGMGYGIRYEFGLFEQHFERGWQVEYPEQWLQFGNPWEFPRAEALYPVQFYGRVETVRDGHRGVAHRWVDSERVLAEAFDTPVVGYGGHTINTLRLWQARATSAL
ncbi:MAG: glycogen/starch/alpha-glucan phosphorylase, partial [Rhodospirillaceae bacterium]